MPSRRDRTNKDFYSRMPSVSLRRSSFNRSYGMRTTIPEAGQLVVIHCDDVLPGDTHRLKTDGVIRLATPRAVPFTNIHAETFYFFVNNRILYDNWTKLMGEQVNPGDSIEFSNPTVTLSGGTQVHSLADYFGLPTNVTGLKVNALPFRAYNLIWNEFFRDQDLVSSAPVNTGPGPDDEADYPIRQRMKRHDYATACRPLPQKGPPVEFPIGTSADVTIFGTGTPQYDAGGGNTGAFGLQANSDNIYFRGSNGGPTGVPLGWQNPNLAGTADLTAATAINVNDLRFAVALQSLLERDSRGGTRYSELLRNQYGVHMPDARWRPEYIGGGSMRININQVAQTSETGQSSQTPQGNLASYGVATGTLGGFNHSADEHGWIIGLMCIRADGSNEYQNGFEKKFFRSTRYDYYFPSFAHLGEEEVFACEVNCANNNHSEEDRENTIFGYNERYASYKTTMNKVTGQMRSNVNGTLHYWHVAQDLGNTSPTLNETFLQEKPPIERIIAVQNEIHFIADLWHTQTSVRPMPVYANPGFRDHF